jgi:hypothetical protein
MALSFAFSRFSPEAKLRERTFSPEIEGIWIPSISGEQGKETDKSV